MDIIFWWYQACNRNEVTKPSLTVSEGRKIGFFLKKKQFKPFFSHKISLSAMLEALRVHLFNAAIESSGIGDNFLN